MTRNGGDWSKNAWLDDRIGVSEFVPEIATIPKPDAAPIQPSSFFASAPSQFRTDGT
jgi:hypothetical protein